MIDAGGCLILLIILGIIYAIIVTVEEKIDNDYDEVLEAKCKKCVNYNMCSRHGRDYMCDCYYPNDIERGDQK